MNQYTYQTTVLNADGDFRRMLKPSALFRYVEQAAADHARAYGMDDAFFKAHHTAFLVGKQAPQITRMPLRAEKLTFLTACEPCKKGSMKRLTTHSGRGREGVALVDCRWIVVDTERAHPAPALLASPGLLERGSGRGAAPAGAQEQRS